MLNKTLKPFAQEKGWYQTPEQAFGLYEGHQFTVANSSWTDNPRLTVLTIFLAQASPTQINELVAFFGEKVTRKKYGYKEVSTDGSHLVFSFTESLRRTKPEEIEALMQAIIAELIQRDIKAEPKFLHPEEYKLGYYDFSGAGTILSQEEYNDLRQKTGQLNQQYELERTSYLPGIAGAVLFAIPVVIAWVLLAIYLNIITSIAGIAMAFAAYYGYQYFKGKEDVVMKIILGLVTVAGILIANLATIHFQLIEYSPDLGIADTINLIQYEPEIKDVFLSDLGMSMFLGLFGVGWVIFGISTEPSYIKEAEKVGA